MNSPDSSQIDDDLRQAREAVADLRREHAALADPDAPSLDDEHDSEGSTVGYERARVEGLLERAAARVVALEAAKERQAEGRYGICQSCGRKIGVERLAALPATQECVDCASQRSR